MLVFYKPEICILIEEKYWQGATILGYGIWRVLVHPSGKMYLPSDYRTRLCSMELFSSLIL